MYSLVRMCKRAPRLCVGACARRCVCARVCVCVRARVGVHARVSLYPRDRRVCMHMIIYSILYYGSLFFFFCYDLVCLHRYTS